MDIGSAIAVFLVLALIMLGLFCFVTKYFHYKLKRTIEESNEIYSMVDQVYQRSEEDVQGEFEEYKGKSRAKGGYKDDEDDLHIEMNDLKAPLKNQEDLYKPSQLRSKLNGEGFQPISKQESSREISSLKSFRPEKMNTTNRTSRSNNGNDRDSGSTKHTFINKLVCYNEQGLTVCEVNVKMIRKVSEGVVKENKTCKVQTYSNSDEALEDQLETIGFHKNVFGYYKYETSVEITNMKTDENYLVRSLKTSESKQQISQEEYLRHFNELSPLKLNQ